MTIDELTAIAPLFVVGTFGTKTAETCELPYDAAAYPTELRVPATYYEFSITETLQVDRRLAPPPETLNLRLAGHEVDGVLYGTTAAPEAGSVYLLALGPNPDGQSYGPLTPLHMIEIAGDQLRYATPGRPAVALAGGDWTQLKATVVTALESRGDSSMTIQRYPEVANRVIPASEWDCEHLTQGPKSGGE